MINVIREPIDWFSSHYHFKLYGWSRKPGQRGDQNEMTLEECINTKAPTCSRNHCQGSLTFSPLERELGLGWTFLICGSVVFWFALDPVYSGGTLSSFVATGLNVKRRRIPAKTNNTKAEWSNAPSSECFQTTLSSECSNSLRIP